MEPLRNYRVEHLNSRQGAVLNVCRDSLSRAMLSSRHARGTAWAATLFVLVGLAHPRPTVVFARTRVLNLNNLNQPNGNQLMKGAPDNVLQP